MFFTLAMMPIVNLELTCNKNVFDTTNIVESEFKNMEIPNNQIHIKWQLQLKKTETRYEIFVVFKSCWDCRIDATIIISNKYLNIICMTGVPHFVCTFNQTVTSTMHSNIMLSYAIKATVLHTRIYNLDMTKHLLKDFTGALLNCDAFRDVKIRVSNEEFSAHKCILAARSPVLHKMLETDSFKEGQEDIINISDLRSAVFKEMLYFIYTGHLSLQAKTMANDLMVAANIYEMPDLIKLCGEEFLPKLTKENASKMLKFAVLHNDNFMLGKILNFVANQ